MTTILTKKLLLISLLISVVSAVVGAGASCSGSPARPSGTASGSGLRAQDAGLDPSPVEAKPGISEAEARALLDSMFREAGWRIVNDAPWREGAIEVTLDGYDPEHDLGYEYVAERERNTELSSSEQGRLRQHARILVLDACSGEELRAQAERFLQSLAASLGAEAASFSDPNPSPSQ